MTQDQEAREYMRKRGILDERLLDAVAAGAVEGRLWFYWVDQEGHRTYRSGRALTEAVNPRWLNQAIDASAASRRPALYASPGAWAADRVAVVEGIFDALACEQAGLPAFALAGNELQEEAVPDLLRKKEVFAIPDDDAGGERLLETVTEKLAAHAGLFVVHIPDGCEDIAEVAQRALAQDADPVAAVRQLLGRAEVAVPTDLPRPVDLREALERPMEAPQWSVPGFAPKGHLVTLFGAPGVGKSTLIYDLGVARAQGRPWLGREPGDGVILSLDWEGYQPDVTRILRRLGLTSEDDLSRFQLFPQPGLVLDVPAGLRQLRGLMRRYGPTAVVMDARDSALPNTEETDNSRVAAALRPIVALARELEVAVILLAHEPKAEYYATLSRLRGATGWAQYADQIFRLRRRGDATILEHLKNRAIDRQPPMTVRLEIAGDRDTGSMSLVAEAADFARDRSEKLAEDVLNLVELLKKNGEMRTGAIRETLTWSDKRFYQAAEAAKQDGVRKKARGEWQLAEDGALGIAA